MKRSATSSGASPASTAISTRSRRSAEYAPAMNIACLRSPMWERHLPYQVTRGLLYHVEVAGFCYSVPHGLLREQVETRATARTIEVFHRGKRVAAHLRHYA